MQGFTPFMMAVQNGHASIAHLLVQHGAKATSTDSEGHTALHWAAYAGRERLVSYLLTMGLSPLLKDNMGRTPMHWAAMKVIRKENINHEEYSMFFFCFFFFFFFFFFLTPGVSRNHSPNGKLVKGK
jgi:hypothetical protein